MSNTYHGLWTEVCPHCKSTRVSFQVSYYPNAPEGQRIGEWDGGPSWCTSCEEDTGNGSKKYLQLVGDIVEHAINCLYSTSGQDTADTVMAARILRDILHADLAGKGWWDESNMPSPEEEEEEEE